ncbi:MAG: hypothetical protein M1831_000300 [Alyxoria varia]|nr:MAG: hypothetical protein M1831_000300 [Alyxoria varia]
MPQLRTSQSNANSNGGYSGSSLFLGPTTGKRHGTGRSQIPQTNATPKEPGRPRRMTTPNTGGSDDLFLTLANDEDSPTAAGLSERSPGRRRKVWNSFFDTIDHSDHGSEACRFIRRRFSLTNIRSQSSLTSPYDRRHPPTSSAPSRYAKEERDGTITTSRSSPFGDVGFNRRSKWTAQPSPLNARGGDPADEPISPATKTDRRQFTPLSRLQSRLTNGESTPDSATRHSSLGARTNTPSYSRQRSALPSDFAYSTPETNGTTNTTNGIRDRGRPGSASGIDSEMSNSVASGVWEELEELKSRIKHLEYGGGRSRPRGTSILRDQHNERPGTRHSQSETPRRELLSPVPTSLSRRGSNSGELHPLLRSAMMKTKSYLDPSSYQFLEGSAHDALELAALSRATCQENDSKDDDAFNELAMSQKRIVWKADNLCRNLTDYCISLNENYLNSPSNRRGTNSQSSSQEEASSPVTAVDHRRRLLERAEQLSSRVASRKMERGESRQSAQDQRGRTTRHISLAEDRTGAGSVLDSRTLGRAATTNGHTNHNHNAVDYTHGGTGTGDDGTIRLPSRAATEVSRQNGTYTPTHSPRDLRLSKDYTSRHPLPERKNLSPTVRQVLTNNNNNSSSTSVNSSHTAQPPPNSGNEQQKSQNNGTGRGRSPSSSPERQYITNQKVREGSATGTRNPSRVYNAPNAGANLAERIEAKRQQRVASSGQLGSFPGRSRQATTILPAANESEKEPASTEKSPVENAELERTPSKLKKGKSGGVNAAEDAATPKRSATKEDANATTRPERLSLRSRLPVLFGGGQERRKSAGGKG